MFRVVAQWLKCWLSEKLPNLLPDKSSSFNLDPFPKAPLTFQFPNLSLGSFQWLLLEYAFITYIFFLFSINAS